MKIPDHLRPLEKLLIRLFKKTAAARALGYKGYGTPAEDCLAGAHVAGGVAEQLQQQARSVFRSPSVQVAEIEVLLDVIETAICSHADAQVLMDLVLDAFRVLKEEV